MKRIFTSLLLAFVFQSISAQHICGTDEIYKEAMKNDAIYSKKRKAAIEYLKKMQINQYKTVTTGTGVEFHVPVVVHVLHTGGGVGSNYNPTDANINAFIARINDGFANMIDESTIPGTFNSVNIPIRFYLAQRNELASCSATTGINRINNAANATYNANGVGSPGISDASLKSIVHWNDLDYYNVYIVNKINGVDGYCAPCTFTAGYAYFPSLGGNEIDGMVVLAQQVNGTSNTFIHELGHAFDLYHPFEGGDASNCPPVTVGGCNNDNDEVCDTDPVRLNFTCNPSGNNPCGGSWAASTTQFNYMAYHGCNDRFTPGQVSRIMNVIDNVRTSYKNSAGIDAPPSVLPVMITPPTYTSANAGNTFNLGPTYVKLNTIEYTSDSYSFEGAGSLHYVDHTCNQATTLIKGNAYPITVKTETNAQKVRVYIDYNGDGTFGTTSPELVFSSNGGGGNVTHSGNIVVPTNNTFFQFNTPLRMRVIADNAATITPTMQLNLGQAEDYNITVLAAPLPIVWRSFSVQLEKGNEARLRWTTESETNNALFEIEQSIDGYNFKKIGSLEGAINSNETLTYTFVQQNLSNGTHYFRIKQIDVDGKFTYSEVKSVFVNQQAFTANAYPNPFNDRLHIEIESMKQDRITCTCLNLNGQTCIQKEFIVERGKNNFELMTNQLQSGVYFLQVKHAQGIQTIKIIK